MVDSCHKGQPSAMGGQGMDGVANQDANLAFSALGRGTCDYRTVEEVKKPNAILITGGSGYVASHLAKQLLIR